MRGWNRAGIPRSRMFYILLAAVLLFCCGAILDGNSAMWPEAESGAQLETAAGEQRRREGERKAEPGLSPEETAAYLADTLPYRNGLAEYIARMEKGMEGFITGCATGELKAAQQGLGQMEDAWLWYAYVEFPAPSHEDPSWNRVSDLSVELKDIFERGEAALARWRDGENDSRETARVIVDLRKVFGRIKVELENLDAYIKELEEAVQ